MKHLTNEKIITFIDGKLGEEEKVEVKEHLSQCDKCFLLYADLKSSIDDMSQADLQPAPEILKKKVEEEFGITDEDKEAKNLFSTIKQWYKDFSFTSYLPKQRVLVPVATVLLLAIAILIIDPSNFLRRKTQISTVAKKETDSESKAKVDSDMLAQTDKAKLPNNLVRGKVRMPDFKGMPKDIIKDILNELEVNYEIKYSEEGFKQIPKAGEFIAESDTVFVFLEK